MAEKLRQLTKQDLAPLSLCFPEIIQGLTTEEALILINQEPPYLQLLAFRMAQDACQAIFPTDGELIRAREELERLQKQNNPHIGTWHRIIDRFRSKGLDKNKKPLS